MKKINQYQASSNQGIMMNANENYQNISTTLIQKLAKELTQIDFNRYPDDSCQKLKQKYAEVMNVRSENLIVGNGSDEILGLLTGINISQGKKLYTVSNDFSMYDYYCSMYDGEIVKYPISDLASFDVDEFIRYGLKQEVSIIILSNPNNPTSQSYRKKELIKIVEQFNCPVVIDEAYGEFNDESMIDMIDKYDNLYITRTLSKAYGLAAIRCGFLIANSKQIKTIDQLRVPYNINALTQLAAQVVLSDLSDTNQYINEMKIERDWFYQQVSSLSDFTFYPSKTNFIYGFSKKKKTMLRKLVELQIVIRDYPDDSFRITLANREINQKIINVIMEVNDNA